MYTSTIPYALILFALHRYICGLHMCATNWTPSFSACGSLMALLHHNPAVGGGGSGGGGDSPPPAGASPTRPGPTPTQSQTARRPSSRSPTTPSAHQQQPSLQARNESPHLSSPGPPSTLAGINGASSSGAGALGLQQTADPAVAAPVVTVMALQTSASAAAAAGTAGPSTVTCSLALMRSCSPPARGAGGAAASACSIASHHRFSTSASSAPMDTGDVRELRVPAYLEHCVLRVYISSLDFLRASTAFITFILLYFKALYLPVNAILEFNTFSTLFFLNKSE